MSRKTIQEIKTIILPSVLNSYSVVFFLNNRVLACILLAVTFLNFFAGLCGLIAVMLTVTVAYFMQFDKLQLKKGIFSFNALLFGLGMGSFYESGVFFYSLLIIGALVSLMLTVSLGSWLNRQNLPVLSIPFVTAFWLILLPSDFLNNLGLTQRNIYWMNELYSVGGDWMLNTFQRIDAIPLPHLTEIYLRSLSSVFFQSNLIAGILIAAGLLIASRIAFSLSILGFLTAYIFAFFSGSESASITYYNIGANYIMVALAIGGFFTIPSWKSYLWTIILVPVTTLVLLSINKILTSFSLPVFSLPFSLVVILFINFLQQRMVVGKTILTPFQYYSPETNLYTYLNNNKERHYHFLYHPIFLPFWGKWSVSQGHDGTLTHLGEWAKALDFVIKNEKGLTYHSSGKECSDFYCYNKPVVAPADGFVEEITDNIEDNPIGKVNTTNNWGNSIVLRHSTGLYTQLSHLKKGSFKVRKGDFVKRGDLIALCGNSGRSPEPHLHFQVQGSPAIGAKTIDYPLAYYHTHTNDSAHLQQFKTPSENELISGISIHSGLKKAFDIQPGTSFRFSYKNDKGTHKTEQWETYTDAWNNKYLYCKEQDASAYFINDGLMFYFTAFYGNKKSLLYHFYLAAYKVSMGEGEKIGVTDAMPLNIIGNYKTWIHDLIAPFMQYIRIQYTVTQDDTHTLLDKSQLKLNSYIKATTRKKTELIAEGCLLIKDNNISEFRFQSGKKKIIAQCENC